MQRIWFGGILLLPLLLATSGCGILIGNVKPVEDKTEDYRVLDLSKENSDWKKIEGESDVAFQSKSTASIISLNTACRPLRSHEPNDKIALREFTRQLLLGVEPDEEPSERDLTVAGVKALETTVKGKLQSRNVNLRSVVLKKEQCVYDLMYVAKPDNFSQHESLFSRFVSSLKLN